MGGIPNQGFSISFFKQPYWAAQLLTKWFFSFLCSKDMFERKKQETGDSLFLCFLWELKAHLDQPGPSWGWRGSDPAPPAWHGEQNRLWRAQIHSGRMWALASELTLRWALLARVNPPPCQFQFHLGWGLADEVPSLWQYRHKGPLTEILRKINVSVTVMIHKGQCLGRVREKNLQVTVNQTLKPSSD